MKARIPEQPNTQMVEEVKETKDVVAEEVEEQESATERTTECYSTDFAVGRLVRDPKEADPSRQEERRRLPAFSYLMGSSRVPVDCRVARELGLWQSLVLEKLISDYKEFSQLETWTSVDERVYSPWSLQVLYDLSRHEVFLCVEELFNKGLIALSESVVYESENFWKMLIPVDEAIDNMLRKAGYDV